jgi:hypothetical protein
VNPKTRMVIELALATIGAVLTVVTLIWPTWIETLFNESPDGGDGSAERVFALGWLAATVIFAVLARRDWRRIGEASAS